MKKSMYIWILVVTAILAMGIATTQALAESRSTASEAALFPMDYMNICQGAYDSYTHSEKNAYDLLGQDDGCDGFRAPFTGTIKRISSDWGMVWLESNEPVEYADGTVDYLTILTIHDDDISDFEEKLENKEVIVIPQGTVYVQEGKAISEATNHVHMELIRGAHGTEGARGNLYAYDVFFVPQDTTILDAHGYTWTTRKPGAPTFSADASTAGQVAFSWTSTEYGDHYDLRISRAGESSCFFEMFDIPGNSYVKELEPGNYTATLAAGSFKYSSYTFGNGVSFTVSESGGTTPQTPPDDSNLYMKQPSGSDTCTLYACMMMMRRKVFFMGYDYSSIVEANVRSTAWIEGTGIRGNFTYNGMTVNNDGRALESLSTDAKIAKLKEQLSAHPEGVMVHDYGIPHSVLLTDYDASTDTFYAADPAGSSQGRVPLMSTTFRGSTQTEKIATMDKMWYIASTSTIDLPLLRTGKPTLSVSDGTRYTEALCNWTTAANASYYNLRVYNASDVLVKSVDNITSLRYPLYLEPGSYHATVTAVNTSSSVAPTSSDSASFTVAEEAIPNTAVKESNSIYNKHLYNSYSGVYTWLAAKAYCESKGSYLAVVTSAAENSIITAFSNDNGNARYHWLGAQRLDNNEWAWVNGETFSYTSWMSGEPSGGTESFLGTFDNPGEWNDFDNNCSFMYGFIMECEPNIVTPAPQKDAYMIGDALNAADLNVTVTFTDGSTYSVTDYTVTGFDTTTAGEKTVTVSYGGKSADYNITVGTPTVFPESIVLNASTATLDVGATKQLSANILPSNATDMSVTWSSDAPAIASVSAEGLVTAQATGTAVITAKTVNNLPATCTITVNPKLPESITLSSPTLALEVGGTSQLSATVLPATASDRTVAWSSNAPTIATVSASGVVNAVSAGTAVITVKTVNNLSATCTITVTQLLTDAPIVRITPSSVTANEGDTFTVQVCLEQNSGLAGIALNLQFDTSVLTLGSVTAGAGANEYRLEYNVEPTNTSILKMVFSDNDNQTTNGVLANIDFTVKQGATEGTYPINVTYIANSTFKIVDNNNYANVPLQIVGGNVKIIDYMLGDVYTDQSVDAKDVTKLMRSLVGKDTLNATQTKAADVYPDNSVDAKDVTKLMRVLVGKDSLSSQVLSSSALAKDGVTATVSMTSAEGRANDTLEVLLNITGNPGIASYKFLIDYDSTALTLNSIEKGAQGSTYSLETSEFTTRPVEVLLVQSDNGSTNGTLLKLSFTVREFASSRHYPIKLSYSKKDTANENYKEIALNMRYGYIGVKPMTIADNVSHPIGDANLDNKTDADDVRMVLEKLVGKANMDDGMLYYADFNCDGVINVRDIVQMLQTLNK